MGTPMKSRKIIKIGPGIRIFWAGHGWTVQYRIPGEPFDKDQDSFYLTFRAAAAACIDRHLRGAEALKDIPDMIQLAEARIITVVEALEKGDIKHVQNR